MYVFVDAVRFVVLELDCRTDDVELELAFVAEPNELSFLRRTIQGRILTKSLWGMLLWTTTTTDHMNYSKCYLAMHETIGD